VLLYERVGEADRFVVALNFSSSAQTVALPQPAQRLLSTRMDTADVPAETQLSLRANEGVLLRAATDRL
jgi:hypothetical protein